MKSHYLIYLFGLILMPDTLAQNPSGSDPNKQAFVVGVANYLDAPLRNPVRDAHLIAKTLNSIGFKVHGGGALVDPTSEKLKDEFNLFSVGLKPEDSVVIYFSGHGNQVDGENLLTPVDFAWPENATLPEAIRSGRLQSLLLGNILASLERAKVKVSVILLDCCRSPASKHKVSGVTIDGGLAQPDSQIVNRGDVMIGFAAKHGEVALDGTGENSPFAEALAKRLALPGIALRPTFDQVTRDVLEMTDQRQQPFFYGSLRQEVYLAGLPSGTGLDSTTSSVMIGGPKTLDKLVSRLLEASTRIEVQKLVGEPQKSYVIKSGSSGLDFDLLYERIGTEQYMIQFFYRKAQENEELKLAGMVVWAAEGTAVPVYFGHSDNTLFSLMHTTMGQILENHETESRHACGGGRHPTVVGNFYFARPGGYMNYLLPAPMTDIDTEEVDGSAPFMSFGVIKDDALTEFLGEYVASPPDWVEDETASSGISSMDGVEGNISSNENGTGGLLLSGGAETLKAPITTIGGHQDKWVLFNSLNSPFSAQRWTITNKFPKEWIRKGWGEGYQISHLAGDTDQWFVIMSKRKEGSKRGQSYVSVTHSAV